ncbi:MAG: ISAs1 family transposase [Methylocella sp.]
MHHSKRLCAAWLRLSFDFAQDEGQDVARLEEIGGGKRGFASSPGLCLRGGACHRATGRRWKSNEIKAIPELLEMLALNGAIVSIDAMGRQKAIAAKIAAQGADYVLALKGNQSTLRDDVRATWR